MLRGVQHRVGIRGALRDIFNALTVPNELGGWWVTQAQGTTPKVGALLTLSFSGRQDLSFRILELDPNRLVMFVCFKGPLAWQGTHLQFRLSEDANQVFVDLMHANIGDPDSFLYFNTKWPIYLLSLKAFIETGQGTPYPKETKIHIGD